MNLAQAYKLIELAIGAVMDALGEAGLDAALRGRLSELLEELKASQEALAGAWSRRVAQRMMPAVALESGVALEVRELMALVELMVAAVREPERVVEEELEMPESFGVEQEENYTVVRIFHATDREELRKGDGAIEYGPGRSVGGKLHYGECLISIPKVHKVGGLESPSIWRLEFRPDPNKHVVLLETKSEEEAEFVARVAEAVTKSETREAFVFLHGYNVSFENAARRTGQLAFDLNFVGAPILYSWPSNGKFADYPKDEADAIWSAPHFERFLQLLGQTSGASRIHVIAHSMGNRVACDALKGLSREVAPGVAFQQVMLAAPDVDADTFAELSAALKKVAHRVTLYGSSNDLALKASKVLHGNRRAGEGGAAMLILPDVDSVDASSISTDFLAHSYFSDSWPLLADIRELMVSDHAPEARPGLDEVVRGEGRFFAFRKV